MNEVTTFRWSLFDDVSGYHDAGINAIGIWRPKLSEFGEERGIDLVQECGMSVSSLSWVGGFTGANRQSFDDAIADARDAVRVADQLNADAVAVISGPRAGHTRNHAKRLLVDALKELSDDASDAGVYLAVQPMQARFSQDWTFLDSLDEALEVLDLCNHPAVRLAFDTYHLWWEANLFERIREVAKRTAIVQLNDWNGPPRCACDRLLPGDGAIPLAEIMQAFTESGYSGYFEIGVWSEELWKTDYDMLLAGCISRYCSLCRQAAPLSTR
ncbi:MAG: sugar phosphate isomerase/epimerase family protein [Planctomycetaceae bacterium]